MHLNSNRFALQYLFDEVADNKVHSYNIGVFSITYQTPEDQFIRHNQLRTDPSLQSDHHLLPVPQILAHIVNGLHLDEGKIAINCT
jgi:hypothetical protein